jgi:hypothetical protein
LKRRALPLVAWGGTVALLYLARLLAPTSALFRTILTDGVLIRVGGLTKLALLLVAWRFARGNAASLDAENPAARPWRLFSWGLLAFTLGQAVLTAYQVVTGTNPYPSLGDLFFILSYPLLIAATADFVAAYRRAGYPVGSTRQHVVLGLVVGLSAAAFGYRLLRPALAEPGPLLERLLNVAYPALDLAWLVPAVLLLRITFGFRGGRVFRAWSLVLAGIVAQCGGDILYAYFSGLGDTLLDPLLHAMYVLSYLFIALGAIEHDTLLH